MSSYARTENHAHALAKQPMLLKVPQAAAELNVAVSTAWELVKSGELESIVIGEKMRRVPREALVEYIEAKRQQARAS